MRLQPKAVMEPMITNVTQTRLFSGISPEDTTRLLSCLRARITGYNRDTVIIVEGSHISRFGVLLTGSGRSYKTDPEGNVLTVTLLKAGSEIGVILAASPGRKSPVSVQVEKGSSILFITYDRLMGGCARNCPCHKRLIRNFTGIVAEKGLVLHERLDCLLRATARDKIMAYLKHISDSADGKPFTVPLDRKGMAEYLHMDRSALSRELSSMKKDGIIDFCKSTFRILI